MNWTIGVTYKNEKVDPFGRNTKQEIKDLDLNANQVKTMHVYFIQGQLNQQQIKKACQELFADAIIQVCEHSQEKNSLNLVNEKNAWIIQVKNKPGVTDAVGESARKGLKILGMKPEKVETATTYIIKSELSQSEIKTISEKILANPLIQEYEYVKK